MGHSVVVEAPDWAVSLVDFTDPECCHGYQFGCQCARCVDRSRRTRFYARHGVADPHGLAARESADFFKRPQLYRFDRDVGFHRPLKETECRQILSTSERGSPS